MNLRLSREVMFLLLGVVAMAAIIVGVMNMCPAATSAQSSPAIKSPTGDIDAIPQPEIPAVPVIEGQSNSVVIDNVLENGDALQPRSELPIGIERLARTSH